MNNELVEYSYAYTPAVFKGSQVIKPGVEKETLVYEDSLPSGKVTKRTTLKRVDREVVDSDVYIPA